MELLRPPDIEGYPTGYLLSRIRGRRSRLLRNWNTLVFAEGSAGRNTESPGNVAADAAWITLLKEYGWIYRQMNQGLRTLFEPFFFYAELKTLTVGLRHIGETGDWNINELLDASLLSDGIKTILLQSRDQAAALEGISSVLGDYAAEPLDLAQLLTDKGMRAVEQKIIEAFLQATVRKIAHPVLKQFFMQLIDSRNIMNLYQALRYERAAEPSFLGGGSLPEARLRDLVERDDLAGLSSLFREYTGIVVERPEPSAVELALYRGMTRRIRKAGREAGSIGVILDYLWRCSIEALNRSIIAQGAFLEREAVLAELVR